MRDLVSGFRPFPEVWHTLEDDLNALDFRYIVRFSFILRIFVAGYLGLI